METRTKTFDCVEMKNQIQATILADYEARKDRFASFPDFVRSAAGQSDWARRLRERFGWR